MSQSFYLHLCLFRLHAALGIVLALSTTALAQERQPREVRAIRLTTPLQVDGRLDEEVYAAASPSGGFIQQVPAAGQPATEPTDVWILFDDENVYVSVQAVDSQPERIVANELRRDSNNVFQLNDSITVVFDTFHDRRNGFFFQTNPLGALRDSATKDGSINQNWNTVWDVRTARTEDGYSMEMAIPFKSLRYRGSGEQTWGVNVRRSVKWKNEISSLSPLPASYGGMAIAQMSYAATLVGISPPSGALNLEVKPYAASSVVTDRAAAVPYDNDVRPAAGFDIKYGVTGGLTADLTVNTDFAQVEEDEQQVNLTRFSLVFPEKRDFFLEGQGIFNFGGQAANNPGGNTPVMFFSRRIGLSNGEQVPLIAGGRLNGKAGAFDIGALVVRTDDKEEAAAVATTFSAVRLRRDILRRSGIGMIATGRWPTTAGLDRNALFGVDADLRFYENVQFLGYWARSSSPDTGAGGTEDSYRVRAAYSGDRYGLEANHLNVGRRFNPQVGFVRRPDAAVTNVVARFSPRLRQSQRVRRLIWQADLEYITDAARRRLEDRVLTGAFTMEMHSSDEISVSAERGYEVLPSDFRIASGVTVPRAAYGSTTFVASYSLAQQRRVSGTVRLSRGSFYGGDRTTLAYNSGRVSLSPHIAVEPLLSLNWVDLPYGTFVARLAGGRFVLSPTPRLGFSSLVQYNSSAHSLTASARMRWEYLPGSDLFVVYSDGRDTAPSGGPRLVNRSFAVKATRLLRF